MYIGQVMGIILSICHHQWRRRYYGSKQEQHKERYINQGIQRIQRNEFIPPGEWTVCPPNSRHQYRPSLIMNNDDHDENASLSSTTTIASRVVHDNPKICEMIQHLKRSAIGQIWLEYSNEFLSDGTLALQHLHMVNLSMLWSHSPLLTEVITNSQQFIENRHVRDVRVEKEMENKLPFQHNDSLMTTLYNYTNLDAAHPIFLHKTEIIGNLCIQYSRGELEIVNTVTNKIYDNLLYPFDDYNSEVSKCNKTRKCVDVYTNCQVSECKRYIVLVPQCRFSHSFGTKCENDHDNMKTRTIHIYSIQELCMKHDQISKIKPLREIKTPDKKDGLDFYTGSRLRIDFIHELFLVFPRFADVFDQGLMILNIDNHTHVRYNHLRVSNIYYGSDIQHSRCVLFNTRTNQLEMYRVLDLINGCQENRKESQFIVPKQIVDRIESKTSGFVKRLQYCWLNSCQLAVVVVTSSSKEIGIPKTFDYYQLQIDKADVDNDYYHENHHKKNSNHNSENKIADTCDKDNSDMKTFTIIQQKTITLEYIAPYWITVVYPPEPWIVSLSYWITFALTETSLSNSNLMILIASYLL
jgi:hypothetical protein